MLNRRLYLVGFIGGIALAFAYSQLVRGCGTFLGTGTELFAWSIVAKLFGGMFADRNTWLVLLIAVLAHGLVLLLLSWAFDSATIKFRSKAMRVRFSMLAILLALYGCLLFFALPLSECP